MNNTTDDLRAVVSSGLVWLSNDVARCDGVGSDAEGWREGCDTCLRRTAPRGDDLETSFIHPPSIIAFECEFLIEPNTQDHA